MFPSSNDTPSKRTHDRSIEILFGCRWIWTVTWDSGNKGHLAHQLISPFFYIMQNSERVKHCVSHKTKGAEILWGEEKKATKRQFIQMLPFLYISLRCVCVYRLGISTTNYCGNLLKFILIKVMSFSSMILTWLGSYTMSLFWYCAVLVTPPVMD